ncbi:hypothetical protein WE348_21185 (plasmid) [Alteromonas macleodii]|uniref:hypothetical protein n=1 Tax=Alteromonas macleodii TaxID=28108 RepID=UPI0030D317AC
MKFIDKDICGSSAFDNGVVLKVNQSSLLDAVDADDKVAIYLYLDEVNELMDAVYGDSPDEPAPELPEAFHQLSTNAAELTQSMVVMYGSAVRDCPVAKRNRAYVFIGLDTLHKIKKKLDGEIERREQVKAFDAAFTAMTGCRLGVASDSNKRVLQRVG